ncbi:MAG: right-handed parallel beta-helix repeat-containing protein, partial [Candidatus Pacebacteria bacterium]|nr:right-handed parallel beta-helix repeat-containing protein [Candidatus Paceibacterota bacterium]
TIQYGVDQLSAGDTLIVHASATPYKGNVSIVVSGTSANWITIRGADGAKVKVSATLEASSRGFNFVSTAQYVYATNFECEGFLYGIRLNDGNQHIVLDDIELDGNDTGGYGLKIGGFEATPNGANNCYFRNLDIHNATGYGVHMITGTQDIVFDNCVAHHNAGDGFAGRSSISSPYYLTNLYFIDCESHSNAGDGFDIGGRYGSDVFKNCISRDNGGIQGVGFKTWGTDVWFVNCLVHDNAYNGMNIKNYWPANVYVLNCNFINNASGGSQIVAVISNTEGDGTVNYMDEVDLYLYNNIFMMDGTGAEYKRRAVEFYHTNAETKESNNNYFFSPTNAKAFQFRDNLATYETYYLSDIGAGNAWHTDTGHDADSFSRNTASDGLADPGFTNLANDDYTLIDTSLAVDAGTDVGVNYDILGSLRPQGSTFDIGAFEYIPTDTVPPILSNSSPTGTLTAGTTQTTISLNTNETATCKYSTTPNTPYASITNTFSTTGGTTHSQTITGLSDGNNYNYYVRCIDEANNPNTADFNISFSVASSPLPTTYNILDFAQLIIDWLATAVSTADLNNDGVVNTRDLGIIMSSWEG